MEKLKIGIIGGSGFYQMPELQNATAKRVETEFGDPSDQLMEGTIDGVPVVVLSRHGQGHKFNPTEVNYRANIRALQKLGCTHILASTCCGSLREDLAPGQFVLLDSFIDRTTKRIQTFHDQKSSNQNPEFGKVCHIAMHPSFCPETRKIIAQTAEKIGQDIKETGTMLTIEGPRFSSRAESLMFRAWGADVVNMTTCPEVVLAKELGISYAAIAMVTDYDCWKEDTQAVEAQHVMKVIADNVDAVRKLFVEVVKAIGQEQWGNTIQANKEMAKNSVISW
eukprot:08551.XXX_38666_37565_1 [CDS] Oithona nana genome sequencing.